MTLKNIGKRLHDKATRGETLSPTEQAQLDEWYASQDSDEMERLGNSLREDSLSPLSEQVYSALTQIAEITRRIQEITQENEQIRCEISSIHRKLSESPQPV